MHLKDKTILVTGAAIGLGKSLTYSFAKEKAKIVITYFTNYEKAEKLKNELIDTYKVEVLCLKLDVTNEESIKNMIDLAIKRFGKIDIYKVDMLLK